MEDESKMAKATPKNKPMTKSELLNKIADDTDLTRRQVSDVLDSLSTQISKSLGRRGPGAFALPGLIKIEKKKVPARKARKGVPNPFKPGELMDVAAKPASTKVKVRALKNLIRKPARLVLPRRAGFVRSLSPKKTQVDPPPCHWVAANGGRETGASTRPFPVPHRTVFAAAVISVQ
jgi:nucleoid DNA-binding protein